MIRTILLMMAFGVALSSASIAMTATTDSPQSVNEVEPAIYAIFGQQRGDYFYPNGLVADQITAGAGLRDPVRQISDGVNLISGCRVRSCSEKGAIVAGPGPTIHGAAILHFHCHLGIQGALDPDTGRRNPVRRQICDGQRMALFLSRDLPNDLYRQALYEWARSQGFFGPVDVIYFVPR